MELADFTALLKQSQNSCVDLDALAREGLQLIHKLKVDHPWTHMLVMGFINNPPVEVLTVLSWSDSSVANLRSNQRAIDLIAKLQKLLRENG